MAGRRVEVGGTLVLDSQGLSLYMDQDRAVMNMVRSALDRGANRVISGATLIEVQHDGIERSRLNRVLSQLVIEPFGVEHFKEAARLLMETGLYGHKYAIDAMVAITARRQPGPVVMLTSDLDDMSVLCGERVTLVAV
ncbi:PIN domain-containing protein [Streptosporangium sp. CA-135522]|uniref:PIN domain-containing protein n=1 Tax=Streptosporangium sp. CA-135522 TaxID=3240072 RepID=UPI003D8E3240